MAMAPMCGDLLDNRDVPPRQHFLHTASALDVAREKVRGFRTLRVRADAELR
jgi:hypothetical protein